MNPQDRASRGGFVTGTIRAYSLFYGRAGERIVGYDNETGKGDHRHYREREEPYAFTDVETLVGDFLADLRREGVKL